MQHARKRSLLAIMLTLALLQLAWVPTASAYHYQSNLWGEVWKHHQVNYTTGRYMQYYDYVQMQKTDGPTLLMGTYTCSGGGYSGGGEFEDRDPTAFKWIGGPAQYTTFCLYSVSFGNNNYDTFTGVLRW